MVWRAKDEVHLLTLDANGNLSAGYFIRTVNRVQIDNDFGFDVQVGISKYLPNTSDPRYRVSLEGLIPNDPAFVSQIFKMGFVAVTPPASDPSFPNTFDQVSNTNTATTIDGVVLGAMMTPNTLELRINDGGPQFTYEALLADVVLGKFEVQVDANGNVTARQFTPSSDYVWLPANPLPVAEGQSQTEWGTPYDLAQARYGLSAVTVVTNDGNTQTLNPTELRVTVDFNAEMRYARNGVVVGLTRDAPQLTLEITPIPDETLPTQFAKVGHANLSTPITISFNGLFSIDLYEYVVQTDRFEVADGYPSPTVTLVGMRYVLKDGNGNAVVGIV